jgi:hypothetical protein
MRVKSVSMSGNGGSSSVTLSGDGATIVLRGGRVVVEGRRIWVSPGADYVVVLPRPLVALLGARAVPLAAYREPP